MSLQSISSWRPLRGLRHTLSQDPAARNRFLTLPLGKALRHHLVGILAEIGRRQDGLELMPHQRRPQSGWTRPAARVGLAWSRVMTSPARKT
jgi:hypothetical protein